MASLTEIGLQELKERFPILEDMHMFLENDGWYLPPFTKKGIRLRCWSLDYLLSLLQNKSFKIQRETIRVPPKDIRVFPKDRLMFEIDKVCGEVKLNIPSMLPPREWLLNVLYTLNSESEIFQKVGNIHKDLKLLHSEKGTICLDCKGPKKRNLRIWKPTKETISGVERPRSFDDPRQTMISKEKDINALETKITMLEKRLEKAKKELKQKKKL